MSGSVERMGLPGLAPPVPGPVAIRPLLGAWLGIMAASWAAMVGFGGPPGPTLTYNLLGWAPWVPLTFGLIRVVRRSWDSTLGVGTLAAAHVGLSVAWIAGYSVYIVVLNVWMSGGGWDELRTAAEQRLGFWLFFDWVLYFGVLAAAYAVVHAPRSRAPTAPPERIAVRYTAREVLLDPAEIHWVRAEGNYVRLGRVGRSELTRSTLDGLLEQLGGDFVQTHRSVAVRRSSVREIRKRDADWVAVLDGDVELPIARRRVADVRTSLGLN